MKALKGNIVKNILNDYEGVKSVRAFIRSGKKKGEVRMSNGDIYAIVPSFSPEYEALVKQLKK